MSIRNSIRNVELRAASIEASPRLYEPAAYSIETFCRSHSISRSKLYAMLRSGEGPRLMKCGTRTLISMEAARDWRLAREQAAAVSGSAMSSADRPSRKSHPHDVDVQRSAHARQHRTLTM